MTDTVEASTPRRPWLTWNLCALLLFGIMMFSAVCACWMPVMFAPPLLFLNLPLYGAVVLTWIPVFVLCIRARPNGGLTIIGALLLFAVPAVMCFCVGVFIRAAISECAAAPMPDRVQYACRYAALNDTPYLRTMFEGPAGWPFMVPAK